MNKLLVICGPTATGKTDLGLYLAKKFKGDVLSADSRQVYKGMDIITGKDLPRNSRFKIQDSSIGYWETPGGTRIWLTDMVGPKEEFSVAQWNRAAQLVMQKLWREERLPIVVGGTGLYIKAIVNGIDTIDVPPNKLLRARIAEKSASELFDILARLDSLRVAGMNQSDRKNPRRLLRAIEVAASRNASETTDTAKWFPSAVDILLVGVEAPLRVLPERVDERVAERLKHGAIDEVAKLRKSGVSWDHQSMGGLGYRQLRGFFEGKLTLEEARRAWISAEARYAREQLAWFKRDKRIMWFDVTKPSWMAKVEKLVENWYTTN